MMVLGIETSCDDTSIALIQGDNRSEEILYHQSFSQENLLKKWGGVVPEIAARNHLIKLKLLLKDLQSTTQIEMEEVDLIGVTTHPGLLGPLLTGLNAAKTISLIYKKPLLGVNHLYAHLEAIHIDQQVDYPYLGLLVSGGHSLIFHVHSKGLFEVLSSTIDDAAGEAFDKAGKMMGMDYPAGKLIDELAINGDPLKFPFSVSMRDSENMSFSGIKTALNRLLDKNPGIIESKQDHANLCASYQECIVNTLINKVSKQYKKQPMPIVIGGGVACNSRLRSVFKDHFPEVFIVSPQYCTDNAAMVANFALINSDKANKFPQSLDIHAQNRFIQKDSFK